MSSFDRSSVTGIGNRVPSANRKFSTTLVNASLSVASQNQDITRDILVVISLIQEAFQRAEASVQDEFEVAQLTLLRRE